MVPQSCALPVLITRPEEQARRFASQVTARFGDAVSVVVSPLLAPEFFSPRLPDRAYKALILTSETAVHAAQILMAQGVTLPEQAYCVGGHTAKVAASAGFSARSADGNADALFDDLMKAPHRGPYLHLRGKDTRGDLAGRLTAAGRLTDEAIVYAQIACPLSTSAAELLATEGPVCIPVFSPRSARLLAQALDRLPRNATLHIVAISAAVGPELSAVGPATLTIAAEPTAKAMLDAMGDLVFNA